MENTHDPSSSGSLFTTAELAKLPAWARTKIHQLEREKLGFWLTLKEVLEPEPPEEDWHLLISTTLTKQRKSGEARVRFVRGSMDYAEVYMEKDGTLLVRTMAPMHIAPDVSNCIRVRW